MGRQKKARVESRERDTFVSRPTLTTTMRSTYGTLEERRETFDVENPLPLSSFTSSHNNNGRRSHFHHHHHLDDQHRGGDAMMVMRDDDALGRRSDDHQPRQKREEEEQEEDKRTVATRVAVLSVAAMASLAVVQKTSERTLYPGGGARPRNDDFNGGDVLGGNHLVSGKPTTTTKAMI